MGHASLPLLLAVLFSPFSASPRTPGRAEISVIVRFSGRIGAEASFHMQCRRGSSPFRLTWTCEDDRRRRRRLQQPRAGVRQGYNQRAAIVPGRRYSPEPGRDGNVPWPPSKT